MEIPQFKQALKKKLTTHVFTYTIKKVTTNADLQILILNNKDLKEK